MRRLFGFGAFTVTLNGQTAFGTKAAPATAAQFPVGTQVRVTGTRTGTTITATRIGVPRTPPAAGATGAPAAGATGAPAVVETGAPAAPGGST